MMFSSKSSSVMAESQIEVNGEDVRYLRDIMQSGEIYIFKNETLTFSSFIDRRPRLCVVFRLDLIYFPNKSPSFCCFLFSVLRSNETMTWIGFLLCLRLSSDMNYRFWLPTVAQQKKKKQKKKARVTGCYRFNNFFSVSTKFVVLKPLLCKN